MKDRKKERRREGRKGQYILLIFGESVEEYTELLQICPINKIYLLFFKSGKWLTH